MKSIKTANGFEYVEILPDGFTVGKKYPVIVHYHGHGWTQKEMKNFSENYTVLASMEKFANEKGFAVILPLCQEFSWFDCFTELKNFTRGVLALPFVDLDKVYCSGISMGACAAWQMLCTLNDAFAAGIICCGIPMYWDARRRLKAPVWAFHGLEDQIIFAEETEKIAKIINGNGGLIKTTFYEGVAHSCWNAAYGQEETYDWLLSRRKEG